MCRLRALETDQVGAEHPAEQFDTARQLLGECGQTIRRLVAGLTMPDWPEGARRAISFSFSPMFAVSLPGALQVDTMLESFREADGITFDNEGD